jgi:choline dehydrogenase-like flavoprotein
MTIPAQARAVIIGGGISGCSVAYHLAKAGWTDIVLLERRQLTCGHHLACGGADRPAARIANMTRLAKYSADLYVKLEAETGVATGMRQVGSISVALTPANGTKSLLRQATVARIFDVEVHEISPGEVEGEVSASEHRPMWWARSPAAGRPVRPGQHRHGAGQGRADEVARRSLKASRSPRRDRSRWPGHRRRLQVPMASRPYRRRCRRQLRRHVGP